MKQNWTSWIDEVASDKLTVDPTDMVTEGQSNLWSFTLPSDDASARDHKIIERFIEQVIDARCSVLRERGAPSGSMRFYCWHDEMAAQLRFSLVSACHEKLPFGCIVDPVPELVRIVESFVSSPNHAGIPFSELDEVEFDHQPEERAYSLRLWERAIP